MLLIIILFLKELPSASDPAGLRTARSGFAKRPSKMLAESKICESKEANQRMRDELPEDWSGALALVGQAKDRRAFSTLFEHFGPRVKSLMLKYGASGELAEEIVQETFVLVWRKASQFDESKAAASTWIFTIARNKRIDILRRQNRPEPDEDDPLFQPDPIPQSDSLLVGKERAAAVQRAMAKLPEQQREVLQRSYFAEETHTEIAQSLKAPLGTVKSRLRLALVKLRTLIDEDVGEGSI